MTTSTAASPNPTSGSGRVTYEVTDHVATMTIDNGRLNLWTMAMHEQLHRHYLRFLHDDTVTVGVITGQGSNFSAGDDLRESETPIKSRMNPRWDEMTVMLRRTKPMVAAMNGYCLGQGLFYALLLSDIRIAGQSARLGFPEIAYGMGGIGGAARLATQLPPVTASYLALTGEKIDAHRARESFLVNEVVDDAECLARATQIARTIAAHPLVAVMTELDGLHRGAELSRSDALHHANQQYQRQRAAHLASGHSTLGDLSTTRAQQKGRPS